MIQIQENKKSWDLIKTRYMENSIGFIYNHRIYIVLFIVAGILDAISTIYFMNKVGPEYEVNTLIRTLVLDYGIVIGTIIGKAFQIVIGILTLVYLKQYAKYIFTLAIVLYVFAAISNFINF